MSRRLRRRIARRRECQRLARQRGDALTFTQYADLSWITGPVSPCCDACGQTLPLRWIPNGYSRPFEWIATA